jgi:Ca2+-binding RTX toxin-like protein
MLSRRSSRRQQRLSYALEVLESRELLAATNLNVDFRSGQSFITWNEDTSRSGEGYNVYRHNQPITTSNLNQAEKLTSKWGPLDDDTSIHKLATGSAPGRFVIDDLGRVLDANEGLFVYTTQSNDSGNAYYAVTQVNGGNEDRTIRAGVNATSSAVSESVQTPQPVLVRSVNGGRGRTYTQFMDYDDWNPSFQGYAYNYHVALPGNYDPGQSYPLKLVLHAYNERMASPSESEFGWQAIQVFADDPGFDTGTPHTWWYGFSADHDYADGGIPDAGQVRNFTEERVLQAIDEVIDNADFNVDSRRIHAQGFSMGASGALQLGVRYGNVFSSIYAPAAMSDYARDTNFQSDFVQLWGSKSDNLPVVNSGRRSGQLRASNNSVGVWDWMDIPQTLRTNPDFDMSHMSIFAGKADDIINYSTQTAPLITAFNDVGVSFTAELRSGWDHNFPGFSGVSHQMISGGAVTDLGIYEFRRQSLPAVTRSQNSGPNSPGGGATDTYNLDIEWSVPWNDFGQPIVDSANRYEVTLKSTTTSQTATITPRRTENFEVVPGATYSWQNFNADTGAVADSGNVTANASGVVSISGFRIRNGSGSRLVMIRTGGGDTGGGDTGGDDGGGDSGNAGAEIRNDTLFVEGGSGNDDIVISKSGSNTRVKNNGSTETFTSSQFSKIIVQTFAGNDKVSVSSPKPTRVEAGSGNDSVLTGKGDDTLIGSSGADTLRGRNGDDSIVGGNGPDELIGDNQDDTLVGGSGNDTIFAGSGQDKASGGGGSDILVGGSGADELNGGSSRDLLIGGNGADKLNGGASEDILIGGRTRYDGSVTALDELMAEWTSGRSYSVRTQNIRTGKAAASGSKLTDATIRADSGERDSITGGSGRDWFFREFDALLDRQSDEDRDIFE